jgi:hypothetical protein
MLSFRRGLPTLTDIGESTGRLGLSNHTWMKVNDLHADRGVELQTWLANIDWYRRVNRAARLVESDLDEGERSPCCP